MGLLESNSLWVEIPIEERLPTSGSPQTPQKRDPHWEVVVVILLGKLAYICNALNDDSANCLLDE